MTGVRFVQFHTLRFRFDVGLRKIHDTIETLSIATERTLRHFWSLIVPRHSPFCNAEAGNIPKLELLAGP